MAAPPNDGSTLQLDRRRIVRVNVSDTVAESIVEMLVRGELRPGQRVDLDAIASSFGVSRAPVREALLVLQREGIVEMPYHRGSFIARFDAETVHEAFEIYALLHTLNTARVARHRSAEVLAPLAVAAEEAIEAATVDEFEAASREFRRIINTTAASPHLRALLRTFGGLVPVASRLAIEGRLDEEREFVRAENEAIQNGEVERACAVTIMHMRGLGGHAVQALRDRGVIDDDAVVRTDPDLETLFQALNREEER